MSKYKKKLKSVNDFELPHFKYLELLLKETPRNNNELKEHKKKDENYFNDRLMYLRKKINKKATKTFLSGNTSTSNYLGSLKESKYVLEEEHEYFNGRKKVKSKFIRINPDKFKEIYALFYLKGKFNTLFMSQYFKYGYLLLDELEDKLGIVSYEGNVDFFYYYFTNTKKVEDFINLLKTNIPELNTKSSIINLINLSIGINSLLDYSILSNKKLNEDDIKPIKINNLKLKQHYHLQGFMKGVSGMVERINNDKNIRIIKKN